MTHDEAKKCVGQMVRIRPTDNGQYWGKGLLCYLVRDCGVVKLAHNLERKIPVAHMKPWKSAHSTKTEATPLPPFFPPVGLTPPTPIVPEQTQETPMANLPTPTEPSDDIAAMIAEFNAANKECREAKTFVDEARLVAANAVERLAAAKAALREALKT